MSRAADRCVKMFYRPEYFFVPSNHLGNRVVGVGKNGKRDMGAWGPWGSLGSLGW